MQRDRWPGKRRSLRHEQVEATRHALLDAARLRFGTDGYAAASVEALAADAGVTTGAIYHHFDTKAGLFQAVFEALHVELRDRSIAAALTAGAPLDILRVAFDAFLDAVLDPAIQQILLVDAPSVLGLERFTEIDERYSYADVLLTLQAAAEEGAIPGDDLDTLAHLLLGALTQGGLLIARSPDQRAARASVGRTIAALVDGLATRA